jgi:predicted histone-like DNA-binding protein
MTVKFNVIERGKPGDLTAPKKFYPSVISTGKIHQRALARQVAEISTVSPADVAGTVEALLSQIPRELANGNIVDLGDFGSFRVRIQTEGSDTTEEATANKIKRVSVRFIPGKEFQQVLNTIEFQKA